MESKVAPSSPILSVSSRKTNPFQLYSLWNHGNGEKNSVEVLVGDRHILAFGWCAARQCKVAR